jgi:Rieske Fe-S protein
MNQRDINPAAKDAAARRSFLARASAVAIGAIVTLFPFAAGLGVLVDPLRRRGTAGGDASLDTAGFVRICPLEALPADGVPRQFVVTSDVADAWSRTPGQRIGSLFLIRTEAGGKPHVSAFTATCPHLGCAVEYDAAEGRFECPCHESAFAADGHKLFGPSLRGLDPLAVKLLDDQGTREIWVEFRKFRAGIAERTPVG